MAVLHEEYGTSRRRVFEVSDAVTTIGRHEDCDVLIDSPAVSRFHSHILCAEGRYFVEDLNSRNGTLLNGIPVVQKSLISDGDEISFASLPYKFLLQNSLSEASGSWGIKADVIRISPQVATDDDSIRRQTVAPGDRIADDALGTDSVRHGQLVARVSVADPAAGWPVVHNSTQKLSFVLRLLHSLRRTVTRDQVVGRSLQSLFDTFPTAERIAVVLREPHLDGLRIEAAVCRDSSDEVEICLPVIRTGMQHSEGLLYVDHWNTSDGKDPELDNPSLRSILAVPLVGLIGECMGVIQVDSTNQKTPLSTDDLELLAVLANVISCAIEQAAASEAELARAVAKQKAKDASELRNHLTAVSPPRVPGYRLLDSLWAAPDMAADLVDYVKLPDGRIACCLIDVPGRGPTAANLMAAIARLLSESISETGSAAKAIQSTENTLAGRLAEIPLVISVAVLILDTQRSSVTVSVAGHCPLFLIHDSELTAIDSPEHSGPPIGTHLELRNETEFLLSDDDLILLVSDGLFKLRSPAGETMGRSAALKLLERCATQPRNELDSFFYAQFSEFRGESPLLDDVTIALIHKTPSADTMDISPGLMDSETLFQ